MRRAVMIALGLATLAQGGRALAQPGQVGASIEARRDRVVSLAVPALQGFGGLAVQGEQLLGARRISVVAGIGVRSAAGGDFSSRTVALSGEARYWFTGRALWTRLPQRSMVGWFAGGRLDLAWTGIHDDYDDRALSSNVGVAITATGGYRVALKRRLELTPSMGLGVTTETDPSGRLPAFNRGTLRFGLTLGWMF
jgi:hypothetical protein